MRPGALASHGRGKGEGGRKKSSPCCADRHPLFVVFSFSLPFGCRQLNKRASKGEGGRKLEGCYYCIGISVLLQLDVVA